MEVIRIIFKPKTGQTNGGSWKHTTWSSLQSDDRAPISLYGYCCN